jgi:hypothetical protein
MAMYDQDEPTAILATEPEAADIRSVPGPVRVRVLNDWQELERWRPQWEHLLVDCPSASIFSTPEWLEAYWHAYARDRETSCLLFLGSNDEIAGLVGLSLEPVRAFLGILVRHLCFIGDGTYESVRLDLVVKLGWERDCARAFIDWLSLHKQWDICELNTFAPDSRTLSELLSMLSARKWKHRILTTPSSAIPLPDSWEKYLSQIPRKERSKIKRRFKEVENCFQVSFTKCTDEVEIPVALNALYELHQSRWKRRGMSGTFSSAERRAFYREMALSFLKRGWLEFWQMSLDDKLVASQFGFRYGQTLYVLQKGFDPEYMDLSVGYVLEAYVIKTLISDGIRSYDYLHGEENSKQRMGAQLGHYVNLHFARPFSLGALFLRTDELNRITKAWLHGHLPAVLLKILKNVGFHLSSKRIGFGVSC